MRNMRESYDQLAGAAEAYNVGKTQLAAAITSKGVETSPTESYPEMAKKVNAISQETYEINGGEMYAKQLFGSLETPNYWNLYDILAQLLSDGRLVNYGGILLAEYYKGYGSLALGGAGSGGAYIVSDKDENGQFKMYTEDITHTWATEFDGKGNRWVAYCFANEGHGFTISNTNTSPRSIYIGRHVGVIESTVNGRVFKIVVPDGNKLDDFTCASVKTQNFGKDIVLRNISHSSGYMIYNAAQTETAYIELDSLSGGYIFVTMPVLNSCIFKIKNGISGNIFQDNISTLKELIINAQGVVSIANWVNQNSIGDPNIVLYGVEDLSLYYSTLDVKLKTNVSILYDTNDKTKTVVLTYRGYSGWRALEKLTLKEGWCKPLNISACAGLTKENVQTYIFDRLGVNDISTGAVTITLASAVLALFTQEEIDAVVERTNITIVGA